METMCKATWIWYPGDFEIWLGNKMNGRRTERGAFFPPFWKMDSHYVTVEFSKKLSLERDEEIEIFVEGTYNIKLDGKLQFGMPDTFLLPAGEHSLNIKVWNQQSPPSIYINGETVKSDSSWKVTYEDKEWIDESGKASDTSATEYMDAGCWNFDSPELPPSLFELERELHEAVSVKDAGKGKLYDFGKETFGFLILGGLTGSGRVDVYYGESPEEAMDTEHCETLDKLQVEEGQVLDLATGFADVTTEFTEELTDAYLFENSKAFRYVYVVTEGDIAVANAAMAYEYLPVEYRGAFSCNDEELNKIWEVGRYTMHLTTREFFIDGIKRDRWVWSGDAVQSYLMNYYLFFDSETVKRTTWLLRGKDPVTAHTNTIMDYTFYWFIGIYQYYLYSGDKHFVEQIYPRMQTMMDYVLGRTNKDGMVEGMTGDWVFVDWADFPMSKQGALAFEQLLFWKSLETMKVCATLLGRSDEAVRYEKLAADLGAKIMPTFWDEDRKAFVHNVENGVKSDQVNPFPNMFAMILDFLNEEQKKTVMQTVMTNPDVPKITTPYMRFYELEAMCQQGNHDQVMSEMKAYWGGMLNEGATSFWEKYNPEESGTQHLAMYGRPYGKSLCHAWGASPVYLLGRYYLGVQPTKPGYEEYEIRPVLGGLEWMDGIVPTPNGDIKVFMDHQSIVVSAPKQGEGWLYFETANPAPTTSAGAIESLGGCSYRLRIAPEGVTTVNF